MNESCDPDRTGPYRPQADETAAEQPQYVGRYRVERVLGKGGFGVVYLAHDEQLQRLVAVKVPHRRLVSRSEAAEAYLTEARIVAKLDHPHLVPVYDVGSTEDCPFFVVSKFIEGSTLTRKIREDRPSFGEAAELLATVAEALHYAHRKGVVHRDIKPGNILLDAAGHPHVADFGLALKEENVGTGPTFAGTPAYASPEQAREEGHRVDGRSDIFSLGVVFYELLTGRRPFRGDTREQLLEQITSVEARPPRQVDDTIPNELERICLKALAKRASERYTTAKDLADDLRHFLEQVGMAYGKESLRKNLARRRRRILWSGITAGLIGITGTLMVLKVSGLLFHPEIPSLGTPPVVKVDPVDDGVPTERSDPVDIFHVGWVGRQARAVLDDQSLAGGKGTMPLLKHKDKVYRGYSLAIIINPAVDDVCRFTGTECAFSFELQPKPGIPWVRVEGIDIVVHDYKDLPKYRPSFAKPLERLHVYYVEIDKPGEGTSTFSASYFFQNEVTPGQGARVMEKTTGHDLEFVRLMEGKPEAFIVRVNAK
jgi:predicted Ser/Thr protein kinase